MRIRLLIVVLLLSGSAQAATLTVCPSGCEYSSIQAAADAASPGDTIKVYSGDYQGPIRTTKIVNIVGVDTGNGIPIVHGSINIGPSSKSIVAMQSASGGASISDIKSTGSMVLGEARSLAKQNNTSLTVCHSGCNYSSIQAAINSARPGDTIEVHSGCYLEEIVLNKDIFLRGVDTGSGKPAVGVVWLCGRSMDMVKGISVGIMDGGSPDNPKTQIQCAKIEVCCQPMPKYYCEGGPTIRAGNCTMQ